MVFSYTVAEGDSDSDGIAINANRLTLNGGSIKDAADNDANLSHTALAAQDGHKVDGVRPRLKLTTSDRLKFMPSSGGSDGAYTTDEELIVRAEFTEEGVRGSVTGRPRVTLNFDGGETREATWDPSLIFSPAQYPLVRFFSYVVQEGDLASEGPTISANSVNVNGGFIRDAAGNDAILTHSAVAADSSFIVDAVAPTVSSIAITSGPGDDDTYGTGDKVEVTVTFSENMSLPTSITCGSDVVHCKAELELDIGGTAKTADYQSHDGAEVVYAYTVQAGDTDDNGIAIGANKLTGQHIKDATGKFGYGINDADLSHDAVAADSGHKVATSVQPQESTDATLSGLTLSGVDFGTFASGTITYPASVDSGVTETTVTPTPNHSGASYVIKLGGMEDPDGEISLAVGSNVITVEVTAEDGSTTRTYTVTVTRVEPPSTDANLSSLALSGVNFGTFDSTTTSYTAQVANGVSQTTVTPTVNDSGASYVIKLGGVEDPDGEISLAVGSNVITVEVTAEDGSTTRTYTVTVTRVEPPTPELSDDATLSTLTLSEVDFGTFASGTNSYTAQVANSVSRTTVMPTVNHSGASYVVKLGGVTDADGEIALSVGSNVITVAVTAEDGETTRTYTVTVTRAEPPSTAASLSGLTLSGIDFGTFASGTTSYTADVSDSVSQTTVTPAVNDSGASYVVKLGGVEDDDREISLAVGSNVITIEVTAEDGETTRTYTVTVTRAEPPSTDASLSALILSGVDFGTFASATTSYTADVSDSVSQTTVTPTVSDSGASYVVKLGGVEDDDREISLAVGSNVITIEVTAEDGETTRTYTVTVTRVEPPSTDASLSGLTLSGIDFGTFASGTTSYTADVSDSVSQTTVTTTVNHSGASYVIKLGGVEDSDGTVSLASGSNVITIEVTAENDSTTRTYTVTVTRAEPPSTDASLSGLTLSGIDFGTFASGTTSYTAQVTNSVTQTTVTPTVNDSGASYVVKLGGVEDDDREISLAVGSNVITIEVTAEDGETTRTYTVTVTRAEPPSTDASLSALTLSGVDFGTFASGTTSYTAQVANSVTQTMVTPTVNDSGASYVIKLGAVVDADGVVLLSVGSSVITVEVTAEDDSTTRTYTATVTRAEPPTPELSDDATLNALTLSGIDFGTFDSTTSSYTAQVANSVSQMTLTPTVSDSGASYVVKLGGVEDDDREISLAVGSNVITIEVTAEDGETTRTYTVTVTRAEPPSTDASLSGLTLSGIDFGTFASGTTSYTADVSDSVSQTTVTTTVNHSGASYVIKLGGVEDSDGTVSLASGSNVITIEVTAENDSTTRTYTVTVTRAEPPSTDASLSGLTLSGIDFGTFASGTTSYTAQVTNSVTQTTVTPTVNDSGASYVVKLGGVEDDDREISLAVGSNVITIEVTAEDGETTRTYTVTVTRAEPPSTDASLSALTLSGVDFGTFASGTTSYTAQVANSVTQTMVTPTVNDSGASYVIKLGAVVDADGVVLLSVGSSVITVEVTAEDDSTTRTYTATVTRAEPPTPELSDDATLNALTLSGIDFGTFDSTTSSYTAQVANSVSQMTLTPTVSDSGASYVVKLGGVEDDDREISLAVGSNVITIEVTAEDGETTRTYTVTVTRAEPPSTDASLSGLTLSGIDFGTFASATTSYTADVSDSVSQTRVTPTVNDSGASYVIKLDGTVDSDGVIPLSVGSNAITIEVTAENGGVSRVYTVEVTRSEPATPGTSGQRLEDRYDTNNNGRIDKNEVLEAINDYLFGEADAAISKGDVIRLINLYLFG